MESILSILQTTPFFEELEEEHLRYLSDKAESREYSADTVLFEEGQTADALYVLVAGGVQLSFSNPRTHAEEQMIRSIRVPKRVLGWSVLVDPYKYRATARTLESSILVKLDAEMLRNYCKAHPKFGSEMLKRILWVIGNRLRETRLRLISRRYDDAVITIRGLIEQHAESLTVTSPLHKIPHYLESRLTFSDAFQALEMLRTEGTDTEQYLANLCLDLLEDVRKELQVFQRLQAIYEHVSGASDKEGPSEIRARCSEEFIKLFEGVDYVIRGEENLPEQPGHIFILNHLLNHLDNMLPNEFVLTLDTHFVSSMLLYRKYGEAPIRVIRKSYPDEYGHKKYYDRLGYIYVFAGDVDEVRGGVQASREEQRREFLDTATKHLLSGKNIVICPEGTCTATNESPFPFKAGAFRLAAHVKPEPLIIPIAVANFDKKITKTRVAAVVQKPFRLSEFVADSNDKEAFFSFVDGYQDTFRPYVQEAIALAEDT